LAAGGSLADLLRARLRLRWPEVLTVLIPLADALAAAHERGIVHGDLSAANVLFDRAGRPLLADLGAARAATEAGVPVAVTVTDVAPEVARGASPAPASDLFSLGSVALHCLSGGPAWPADDLQDVLIQSTAGQWPDPADVLGPPGLLDVVRRLLDPEPARRGSAARAAVELRRVGEPEPVELVQVTEDGAVTGPAPATVIRPDAPHLLVGAAARRGRRRVGVRDRRGGRLAGRRGRRGQRADGGRRASAGRQVSVDRGRAGARGRRAGPTTGGFRPERRGRMGLGGHALSRRAAADMPGRHSRPGWRRRLWSRLTRPRSPGHPTGTGRRPTGRGPAPVLARLQGAGPARAADPAGPVGLRSAGPMGWAGAQEQSGTGRHGRAAPTGGAARSRGPWGMVAAVAVLLLVGTGAIRAGLWWAGWGTVGPTAVSALPTVPAAESPAPSPLTGVNAAGPSPSTGSDTAGPSPPTGFHRPGGARQTASGSPGPPVSSRAPRAGPATADRVDWLAVVAALDRARADALIAADPAMLSEVYTDDSPARAADAGQIAAMVTAGLRVADAGHRLQSATLVADDPGATRVRVVESLPAYPVLDAAGTQVASTGASARSTVVLELVRTTAGYRISRVLPG
ncbi:MAG TPA: protein kinase, partial [Nakamurella sp.]|nr:protein kinase [Nakamurella sp.]